MSGEHVCDGRNLILLVRLVESEDSRSFGEGRPGLQEGGEDFPEANSSAQAQLVRPQVNVDIYIASVRLHWHC